MRRNLSLIAVTVVGITAATLSASAGDGAGVRTPGNAKSRNVQTVQQQKVTADHAAQPSLAELRARVAQLSKQVEQLEAAAAENRRQIILLTNQMEGRVPAATIAQPVTQPVVRRRVVEPVTTYTTDLFPNEYPYGG